ncbi:uncharacterized protein B0I36DRAFT_384151 [Microdochium trichocladiopsis]|uniref:DUF202 domain-containing protein n=1 Tax=Microdochium trichocladiopsis TaxID=1682393 RepID=A0A9P9BQZ7_9PEZI|nr:uncharacterized protein B0I36DRAFT_384151 [Microdochium trichocladiopsis]KAH7031355.1 hypothetical protein B0I36DRAFT_384151 [Microdochium trichocladiopsis]
MFQPGAEDRFHLRMHRARSVVLTSQELVEIRAAQRTFEGAYMRTALSLFSFSLIILKIFTSEFYAIGALFAVYGGAVLVCAVYRRYQGNRQFFTVTGHDGEVAKRFRTSGNTVLILTSLSAAAYVTLIVLTWQLST